MRPSEINVQYRGGYRGPYIDIRTLIEKLMILPERTTVYPGHNDLTTIETERMYNPYL